MNLRLVPASAIAAAIAAFAITPSTWAWNMPASPSPSPMASPPPMSPTSPPPVPMTPTNIIPLPGGFGTGPNGAITTLDQKIRSNEQQVNQIGQDMDNNRDGSAPPVVDNSGNVGTYSNSPATYAGNWKADPDPAHRQVVLNSWIADANALYPQVVRLQQQIAQLQKLPNSAAAVAGLQAKYDTANGQYMAIMQRIQLVQPGATANVTPTH